MSPTVAIVGASGYAGRELAGLLAVHPALELGLRMSARADEASPPADDLAPPVEALDANRFADVDGVFLCTPAGVAAPLARAALAAGTKVVDLSADFRLGDAAVYASTYGLAHPAPELLETAVYGLTEHARGRIVEAELVANPGCYPTSILLPLLPLLRAGVVAEGTPIIADCKSGVSGAGKAPTEHTHFGRVHENARAYGVGTHRHIPEIHEHAGTDRVVFVPHLLPVFRGILTTLYLSPAPGADARSALEALRSAYSGEPFVRVSSAEPPELADVRHTNRCDLAVGQASGQLVVISALDNLVKGAAGQALQNMNLLLGLEEHLGLP